MWRWVLVGIGAAGCGHTGAWQFDRSGTQSISGPQPFVMLDALDPEGTWDLLIECAPDGLQLSFRGQLPQSEATLQFDDAPPLTLPTRISRRGVPVVDLRAPIAGRSDTAEELLVEASRLAVHTAGGGAASVVAFDVAHADRAIQRLHCPVGTSR